MKAKLPTFAAALFAAFAATAALAQQSLRLPVSLIPEGGGQPLDVYLTAATKSAIRYASNLQGTGTTDDKVSNYKAIFFHMPEAYVEAMDLFHARKYDEAKARFATIRELCQPVVKLEGNPATLAAFYEAECMRRSGDIAGAVKSAADIDKDTLPEAAQLAQMELYPLWDAVLKEDWNRVQALVGEQDKKPTNGAIGAQAGFCRGRLLEAKGRLDEAQVAYGTAMVADTGDSVALARDAAVRSMGIYLADDSVKKAMEAWGGESENKGTAGRAKLLRASAIARLYELAYGVGQPLPAECKPLLKYRDEQAAKKAKDEAKGNRD